MTLGSWNVQITNSLRKGQSRRQKTSFFVQLGYAGALLESMKRDLKQTVLLGLVGTTPAVLTETVYALAHRKTPIFPDRVVIATTGPGRTILVEQLFRRGNWEALLMHLRE